ncbi:hypothetical protein ACG873_06705 [Mesorhizobium sp. AaZ16]|uniref:hypothetical protein n=1 Tax=Mesorhizobium sp. AaZ16 TaxID=3402289 RepID=UPI00374EAF53
MDQESLAEFFNDQADWRDQKAREYPDDERNRAAAEHLRMLAKSASDCTQSVITAAEELSEDAPDTEVWHEQLKQVGFHYFPTTAEQFVRDFIAARTC